jgi:hypothetical protein
MDDQRGEVLVLTERLAGEAGDPDGGAESGDDADRSAVAECGEDRSGSRAGASHADLQVAEWLNGALNHD